MTGNETTSLLCLFQLKIEDAVTLVTGMNAEEKLKSVQFWNFISGKLQEIVNDSVADINALALKLDDCDKTVTFHIGSDKVNNMISCINSYTTDFIGDNENFITSSEPTQEYSLEKVDSSQNEQYISVNETPFATISFPEVESTSADAVISISEPEISDNASNCFPKASIGDHMVDITNGRTDPKEHDNENTVSLENCEPIDNQQTAVNVFKGSKYLQKCSYIPPVLNPDDQRGDSDSYLLQLLTSAASNRDFATDSLKIVDSQLSDIQADDTVLCGESVLNSDQQSSYEIANDGSEPVSNEKDAVEKSELLDAGDLICEWCHHAFLDSSSLDAHKVTHTKPFPCTQCNAQFSSKANLRVHFRKHTGEKPFSCVMCVAQFSTRGNLKRHLRSHAGLRPHQCTHCGSCFTEKKSLIVHMRRHTGEKPYECEVCGRRFSQSGILRSHMAVHLNERAHLCEHCGKAFRQKSQLRVHMLRHEGVRKFDCKQCSARFLIKGDLERHKRVHTGERPFICDICHKSFTRQQSLKEHLNRHLGLKPFECKYCSKSFAEMSACYKHVKHHEKTKSQDDNQNSENITKVIEEKSSQGQISSTESLNCDKVMQSQSILVIFQDCDQEVHREFVVENSSKQLQSVKKK